MNIEPHTRISNGDSSNTSILSIHNHTGTHVDAPKHFIDNGKSISEYTLDELIFTNPVIVDCPKTDGSLVTPDDLLHMSHFFEKSDCLLLRTGFGQFRNEERYRTHNPGIAADTIRWIRKEYPNIHLIGIDTISISSFQHRIEGREAHRAAFAEKEDIGIPLLLLEDINLAVISGSISYIIVLPWLMKSLDSAPCTVIAHVD
jgi:kynurenine formamidase